MTSTMLTMFVLVAAAFVTSTLATYTGSRSSENNVGFDPGFGYGYGGAGFGPGVFPQPFFMPFQFPQFDFNNLVQGMYASSSIQIHPSFQGHVRASSSITYDGIHKIQDQVQRASAAGYGNQGGFTGPGSYGSGASAGVGPSGIHQTAYLNPENPSSPNVNTRFGASGPRGGGGSGGGGAGGGDGYRGVFVSSSSGSSNVNGKPMHFRTATTSVNDNGKVTTYTVRD